jgi:acetylornithine deacetylase/succinyl-diaminopimelate desuccinylase-like protein
MAAPIYQHPVELLQRLIRFDTTNPPGNEYACVMYLKGLLDEAGIESTLVSKDPNRPCLIARIAGRGEAPPLMLYGHVDVVSTKGQPWTQDPFAGELIDGMVWGRGALDMKGGVAMMTSAFLRAHAEATNLPGDVILCVVPDEEVDGIWGARFLVEEHADLFAGVRHAIGEFGGYPVSYFGKRFYAITVGEKQTCSLIATVRGNAGHAALPHRGGAAAKLGRLLTALDQRRLPVHITPPIQKMIETIASHLNADEAASLRGLLDPALTDSILDRGMKDGRDFDALLHNTVNATVFRGGSQVNVAPSEITVEMDGRILPGMTTNDLIHEIYDVIGRDTADIRINVFDPGPGDADMGLFDTLAGVLKEADPGAIPIPFVMCGVTDARFFCQIGIQTYGFLPMNLPDDMDIWGTVHNADEHVPAHAIEFGANAIYTALHRFK